MKQKQLWLMLWSCWWEATDRPSRRSRSATIFLVFTPLGMGKFRSKDTVAHLPPLADRVLHAPPPPQAEFVLIFRRWSRQVGSLFRPFRFKVLLSMSNVSAHV
jgi:hypothetical protein